MSSTFITFEASKPEIISVALKEWAVALRALKEGRQVILLRKGGIREAAGEFEVEARDVALLPTYEHQTEQTDSLQPCYTAWRDEETRRQPAEGTTRIDCIAHITDILIVENTNALFTLKNQHIYSDSLLNFRIQSSPEKPLYALFLRTYELPKPVTIPMELDYFGCRSWVTLKEPICTTGATPVLSDHTYNERVRVTRRILTEKDKP